MKDKYSIPEEDKPFLRELLTLCMKYKILIEDGNLCNSEYIAAVHYDHYDGHMRILEKDELEDYEEKQLLRDSS